MTSFYKFSESQRAKLRASRPDLTNQAKKRCRNSFQFFCRYTTGEFWQPYKHLVYLTEILEQVERGEIKRLILNMPPQHGKSFTTSELFPAWYLGRNPHKKVILTSYGADLAKDFSENARNTFAEWGPKIWGLEISDTTAAKNDWKVAGHRGYMVSAGVGGPVTGKGAHILIIDDPHKNRKEAESEIIREDIKNWYKSVIRTRLAMGGAIILIQTRWHPEDLAGHLIKHGGGKWTVINLPAIAKENDPLGRAPGDPLCPELHDQEDLEDIRGDMGEYEFAALYEGNPMSERGNLFKRAYFRYFDISGDLFILHRPAGDLPIPIRSCTCFQTYDPAGSEKSSAAYGVLGTWYLTPHTDLLLVDVMREQKTVPDQVEDVTNRYIRYRPVAIGVEVNGIGLTTFQYLQREGLPIYDVHADADKYSRAVAIATRYRAGTVYHLSDAPYVEPYESELLAFPKGKYKDQVDMAAYAARMLIPVKDQQKRPVVYDLEDEEGISPV